MKYRRLRNQLRTPIKTIYLSMSLYLSISYSLSVSLGVCLSVCFLFVCLSVRQVYAFTTSLLISSPRPPPKKKKKKCSNTLIFAHHSVTQFHTTLPKVFNRDLVLIQHPIRLHSSKDLAEITKLAQDRKCWRGLPSLIEKAAKVSQTKNWDAKRQYVSQ